MYPPLDDPSKLLAALEGPVDQVRLIRGGPLLLDSVHTYALRNLILSRSNDHARGWGEACKRLVELQAPFHSTTEPASAAGIFSSYSPFGGYEEAAAEMAELYEQAGLMELDKPMPGDPSNLLANYPDDGFSPEGLLPIAGAIASDNVFFVEYLLQRGVSLDCGTVFTDAPPYQAAELASLLGSPASRASILAHQMSVRIGHAGPESSAAREGRPSRRCV